MELQAEQPALDSCCPGAQLWGLRIEQASLVGRESARLWVRIPACLLHLGLSPHYLVSQFSPLEDGAMS